uniref:Uncharacterized protein n=1 Tax=uncultured bacterium pES01019D12 TaxID=355333 RepID=A0EJK8_9BACT|nr:hypothetical protein [uncultured bacterium pES01019D12]
MSDREYKLLLSEVIATWFMAIMVVIGGFFGLFEYMEYKNTLRVDRALEFVSRYQSNDHVVSARKEISASIEKHLPEISQVLSNPALGVDELAHVYHDEIMTIVTEDAISAPLEQLFTFYEQVLLCHEMELCDETVLANFFDNDAGSYSRTFYPYICTLRK